MGLIINKKNIMFAALLLMTAALFAQNETGPRILVRSSPERPVAGSTWTLTLLIAHDEPTEVDILAPHFTGSLLLEQVIKSPRFLNPATGQFSVNNPVSAEADKNAASSAAFTMAFERWTAMEYRFVLNNPGTISFAAFTVITPRGQTKTEPFDLRVLRPQNMAETRSYQLAWEGIPSSLAVGENAVFALRINGWDSADSAPETKLFLPPVPPGYILESLPLRPEEKSAGIAIRLRLIPLELTPFVLERRRFLHGGNNFEIPALRIPVTASARSRTVTQVQTREEQSAEESGPVPPFPALETAQKDNPGLYHKHQAECENIYRTAKDLWENGYFAGALAALRKNERDHPAGAFFAVLRRGAEQTLGFTGTRDEKRRSFLGLKNPLPFLKKKSRSAVLRETVVRRIPDSAGEEIARFREGQPVLLDEETYPPARKQRETWLRVIADNDSEISGWVPEENVIVY